jgi:chromate transporter
LQKQTEQRVNKSDADRRGALPDLALLFLRLGTTAFGGPAAHIALMRQEVVERRRWLSEEEFLDLLGAANLIPGPNSTELAIHIGYQRGGWPGLVVAGTCFILPAALIVSAFAWAYVHFRKLPAVAGLLYAVKPVVVAVVVQAIWGLARPAIKNRLVAALAIASLVLALLGADELLLLFGAGALAGTAQWTTHSSTESGWRRARPLALMLLAAAAMAGLPALLTRALPIRPAGPNHALPFGLTPLFLFFLKVGAVLYGSGYVLLAFLRDGLVTRWKWLTSAQLLDAIAVGQVTPGPVFTTATFIGYILGGPWGAATATLGIFLPSFLFVAASGPLVPRIRKSAIAGAFLDGVNAAALALMAAVTLQIARAALVDGFTVALLAASAVLLVRFRVNSAWLILAAAALGIAATFTGLC